MKDILFEGYEPRNYNHEYSKEMTMYDAIVESANVPAVSLLNELGVEEGKAIFRERKCSHC